jgi:hypothetical protein
LSPQLASGMTSNNPANIFEDTGKRPSQALLPHHDTGNLFRMK